MQVMMTASKQSQDGTAWLCLEAVIITCMKLTSAECTVWDSWWWAKKLPQTCRVLWQNNLDKQCVWVVIKKKSVSTHGNMNVKSVTKLSRWYTTGTEISNLRLFHSTGGSSSYIVLDTCSLQLFNSACSFTNRALAVCWPPLQLAYKNCVATRNTLCESPLLNCINP